MSKHSTLVYATKCLIRTICLSSVMLSCGPQSQSDKSRVLTDLGRSNADVAHRLNQYKLKTKHCTYDSKAQFKVLIAGFGPFSGRPINTSGLVAMNFSRLYNDRNAPMTVPVISANDADGITSQDQVKINDKTVAICAVEASVIWDLAGAIYLHEASLFRPDLIIMSGMDGGSMHVGTWENHTKNQAVGSAGYEGNGAPSVVTPNTAGSSTIEIVPGGPLSLSMSWNSAQLVAVTNPILQQKMPNFSVQSPPDSTPGQYLCNNVSYVVLAGLSGKTIPLAGGMMPVSVNGLSHTRAGFFHYPWASPQTSSAVRVWTDILAAAITSEMGPLTSTTPDSQLRQKQREK